jgi:hypothetical protein
MDMWQNQRDFDQANEDYRTSLLILLVYIVLDYNLNWAITKTLWAVVCWLAGLI